MSYRGNQSVAARGGPGLVLAGAALAGNLGWMDGEFRVGDPATRADQWSKPAILGVQALALVGCCLLAFAVWRWRKGTGPTGSLRVTGLMLYGVAGAGLIADLGGIITNSRGSLGDEMDAQGAMIVIVLGFAVAVVAGGLAAWAVRVAGYRESRAAAEAAAMGLPTAG